MDKIVKHSTSILVFIINILLTVAGFLLIKNNEAQKRLSKQLNSAALPVLEDPAADSQATLPDIANSVPAADISPLAAPTLKSAPASAPKPAPKATTTTRTS